MTREHATVESQSLGPIQAPSIPGSARAPYFSAVENWARSLESALEEVLDEPKFSSRQHGTSAQTQLRRDNERSAARVAQGDFEVLARRREAAAAGTPGAKLAAKEDALLQLQCVREDALARLANQSAEQGQQGQLWLSQQLEIMASNLKSVAATVHAVMSGTPGEAGNGEEHSVAADRLLGWGEQLSTSGLVTIEDKHQIKYVACNGHRGLYVSRAGDVFSIGDDSTGLPQGLSSGSNPTRPKVVGELVLERVLLGRRVVLVACGHMHSCALTQGGRLWSWGCGLDGRLGHGDTLDQTTPRLCEELLQHHVRAVACGGAHTVAVVAPSRVYSWGLGRYGRLGLGTQQSHNSPQLVQLDPRGLAEAESFRALFGTAPPFSLQASRDEAIVSVACGWAFTVLVGALGTVRVFGAGSDGQCGMLPARDRSLPIVLESISGLGVSQVTCGYHHALAVTADGRVYAWGHGESAQLGLGVHTSSAYEPQPVVLPGPAVAAVAGQWHSLCILASGSLIGWGSNVHGAIDPSSSDLGLWWVPKHISEVLHDKDKNRDLRSSHLAAGAHFSVLVSRFAGDKLSEVDFVNVHDETSARSRWSAREVLAQAVVTAQIESGSFCSGRIGVYERGSVRGRIGVLTSTGTIELFANLESRDPEATLEVRGRDVELHCKGRFLEAWRIRPGEEYSLLLRLRLNSQAEARAWAKHLAQFLHKGSTSNSMAAESSARKVDVNSRSWAWRRGIGNRLRITPELYVIYKERATRREDGIVLDVRRTLPTLALFGNRGEPLHEQLREVLEVYQVYRPDIGYVQGMSYIAAMLCLHMPNSHFESFVALSNLLATHHLFDFFRVSQAYDRVQAYYGIIDSMLAKTSPRLSKHLHNVGVMDEVHVTCFQWLQTLFVRRLPLEQVTQLWDEFLCQQDTLVMFRACVALLMAMERSILAVREPEDVLLLLRTSKHGQEVVKLAFTVVHPPHEAKERLRRLTQYDDSSAPDLPHP